MLKKQALKLLVLKCLLSPLFLKFQRASLYGLNFSSFMIDSFFRSNSLRWAGFRMLLCCLPVAVFSQNQDDTTIYRLNWHKDVPVLAVGVGLNIAGFAYIQSMAPRSILDIQQLARPRLLGIDEKAIKNYSQPAAHTSDFLLGGSALLPFTLMADADIRQDAKKVSVLLSETMLLTHGLTLVTKRITLRDRPFVFNPDVPLKEKLEADSRMSFFSGHTSMTAGFSFFTATVWSDYHPYSKWKPVVWTAAAAVPAVTGYLRYKAGKHYFTDVITGYAVGAMAGYLVPRLHRIDTKSKRKLRISSTTKEGTPVFVLRCLW